MNKLKNKFIKKFFLLGFFLFIYLYFYPVTSASIPHDLPDMSAQYTFSNIYYLLTRLGSWLFSFLAIGSLIGSLVGAFIIATSGGDSGKLSNGKKIIIYSLLSAFIASFAFGMVQLAINLMAP